MRGYPQFSFRNFNSPCKDLLFLHSHKPYKNTSVLVGTVFNLASHKPRKNQTFVFCFFVFVFVFCFLPVSCRAFEQLVQPSSGALADLGLQKSECPLGRLVLWECAVLELTDALKQTLPTCASRNIRKTVWGTCQFFFPTGLFKQPVNDRSLGSS